MELNESLFISCDSIIAGEAEGKILGTFKVLAAIQAQGGKISLAVSADTCRWECWLGVPDRELAVPDRYIKREHAQLLAVYLSVYSRGVKQLFADFITHLGLREQELRPGIKYWN